MSVTGLSLQELNDAMASGVSKPAPVELFHNLGMFDTWQNMKLFVDHYIPAYIFESDSGHRLQKWMREYLQGRWVDILLFNQSSFTGGRYRFTVPFVEYFLMNGLQSPHKLLNSYIENHVGCLPGDTGEPFYLKEPSLQIEVYMLGFEWEWLKTGRFVLQLPIPPFDIW